MDLSIIIVNYKTKDLTLQALASVFNAQAPRDKPEVILVDNASDDDTAEIVRKKFPQVKVIEAPANLGFAGGNNLGFRRAKGRYQLLLNSDTLVEPETFIKMVEYMDENPKVGLSTCRVELKNGRIDPASHRGFPTPWASLTYYLGLEKLFPQSHRNRYLLFKAHYWNWLNLRIPDSGATIQNTN